MKKTNKQIIKELREHRDTARFFDVPYSARLPRRTERMIENNTRQNFFHWWDSWIAPELDELERRLIRKSRRKT